MRSNISLSRTAITGALLVALVGTAGCSWFRKSNELYAPAAETRPLEVPPDLDLPRTAANAGAPAGSVTASGAVAAASATTVPPPVAPVPGVAAAPQAAGTAPAPVPTVAGAPVAPAPGFNMAGSRDDAFARIDTALAGIEGVSVASRAKLLGVFDVNYKGVNFLVRVSEVEAGAYVSAVDPRGMPASGEAPAELISQLRAVLGVN